MTMADVIFTGNAGADGQLRFTPSGAAVYELRIADTKSKKLDNGEWEEIATQWLNVSVWGSLAEHLATLDIKKGTRVKVVGEFFAREYEHNGQTRQSLDVKAWGVDVFQKRTGQGQTRSQQPRQQAPADPWGAPQAPRAQADPWAQPASSQDAITPSF